VPARSSECGTPMREALVFVIGLILGALMVKNGILLG